MRARLQKLNFEFHAPPLKNKEGHTTLTSEESKPFADRNQARAGSLSVAPATANFPRERFGTGPSIKNPYAKPASRFTHHHLVSEELKRCARTASSHTDESRIPTFSGLPTAASKRLPGDSNAAPSSPQTILEKLRPHPPTPEIAENPFVSRGEEIGGTVVCPRGIITQEAALEDLSNPDNISLLSNDKEDDEGSFASKAEEDSFNDETSSDGMFSSFDTLRNRGMAFLLDYGNGGFNLFLRFTLMLHALRLSFGLRKRMASSEDTANMEDKCTQLNDGKDNEGPLALNQEDDKDSVMDEILGGEIGSPFSGILRKSGTALLFCLSTGGSIFLFCLVMMLRVLGLSIGVGVAMGYLVLLGKIDVPAVNDVLRVRFGQ